ncbi:MAG: DUF1830 domain-containing protein [Oscillatoriaceae bacterium SKW80]|nr:DUF1830 domain-containing protein [Oscillatoriaceae bacterium SKYG93]MCX8121899.1 DUF1830 domain-containing protein [Oscillatoriaceae bacterium SKW80]MDW8454660.1 DUF1830 domain-containing protein [Oscillatoriaceae cyanobacterium SKYGB_i_bin93]HIK28635.1 DUF1830 domain-containing protein [Oscillatoriaceae cyanobacterium M7585_C2015_266]
MAQILDPLPADRSGEILCCYVNASSKIQVVRITNIPNWYFERVVFPGQRLVFEAFPEALLEIHTGMMATAILSDKIPCHRLRISDEIQSFGKREDEPKEEITIHKSGIQTTSNNRGKIKSLMTPALTAVD